MPESLTPDQLLHAFNLRAIMPEIVLSLSALVVLLAGAFLGDNVQRRVLPALAILGAIATAIPAAVLWDQNLLFGPADKAIYAADNFSLFFKFLFLIGLVVTILISGRILSPREGDTHMVAGEYYTLLMLATVGMMLVAGARDLLVVFLGIETLSIALYILAGFARRRLMSNEAALKYFLLGAFASGFLLYGIALMYFSVGSTLLPTIAQFAANGASGSPLASFGAATFYLGVAFLLIGLGFKAALVPFHQWTPDVYEGSPTPVTAFMATGAKAAAFAAILRVFPEALGAAPVSSQWHHLVLVLAVLTMTIGNVTAIAQNSLKRMLAYSSIAHAGYLLVGVLAAGAATRNANLAGMADAAARAKGSVLFYLFIYALMNLGAFAVLIYLENRRAAENEHSATSQSIVDSGNTNLTTDDLRGLASREPLVAAAFTIFLLSLAGIPPTAGFFGKFSIFLEAMQQGLVGLLIVGVLNSVISVFYYLRPVWSMYSPRETTTVGVASGEVVAGADGAAVVSTSRAASLGLVLAITLCVIGVLGLIALQYALVPIVQSAAGLQTP